MSGLRVLAEEEISSTVTPLAGRASLDLPADVEDGLRSALEAESQPRARFALEMIIENARIAREKNLPLCQDTGFFHLFVSLGNATALPARFQAAADTGIKVATEKYYLRSSIISDPLSVRPDRGDNSPLLVHIDQCDLDSAARFTVLAKGGGSENTTGLHMLLPGEGSAGLKKAVLET